MRKVRIVLMILILLLINGCSPKNSSVKTAEIIIHGNQYYEKDDIDDAIKIVKDDLNTMPKFVKVRSIKYDEVLFSESFYHNKKDYIIIYVDFYVEDHNDLESGFQPDSDYLNWQYILLKSDDDNWEIVNQGY